jgi:FlaA1/EpsC-like NDP-sugar epimerase
MHLQLTAQVEESLLGRPVRHVIDESGRTHYAGRRCLVTGAGGSIGAELARQLAACQPSLLTLVDHSEALLFEIERELAERWPDVALDPVLADITRATPTQMAFRRARPHIVFHAAAYKHVTMAERAVCAAARVNVLGTANVVSAARQAGSRFLLVSTDKATAPHSVMGATKRLAEMVAVGAASRTFRPAVVRFGNVLGSSGSLIPVALDRLRRGLSVQVTDPDATRYFMTVSEAAALLMKADMMACAGETFWLDMGAPVRVGDLVERLCGIAARDGVQPRPIEVIGLRPGEKREEELATASLRLCRTGDPHIWMARQPSLTRGGFQEALRALRRHVGRGDAAGVLATLVHLVPDYQPSAEAWALAQIDQLFLEADLPVGRLHVA